MKKIILTACALAISTTFAIAQSSSSQGGAATSPTGNTANSANGNNMTQEGKMKRESGTTGMSNPNGTSTGQAGTGAANGNNAPASGSR